MTPAAALFRSLGDPVRLAIALRIKSAGYAGSTPGLRAAPSAPSSAGRSSCDGIAWMESLCARVSSSHVTDDGEQDAGHMDRSTP